MGFKSYAIKEATLLRLKEQEARGVWCPWHVWVTPTPLAGLAPVTSRKGDDEAGPDQAQSERLWREAIDKQGYYACALGEVGIAVTGVASNASANQWQRGLTHHWAQQVARAYNAGGPRAAIELMQTIPVD